MFIARFLAIIITFTLAHGFMHAQIYDGITQGARKGVVATVRHKFDSAWWVQGKYDGGTKAIDISCAFNFN